MRKFYLTTAIDYVNAPPHLGHAYEKILADLIARYFRQKGKEVFFLTGTDENSLKNVFSAKRKKISVENLVEKNSKKFYKLKLALSLSFDEFIRTSKKKHFFGVQELWKRCQKDIYRKKYKGLYCIECEEFYKERELVNGLCPEHKKKPVLIEEENYFFALSKYQKKLERVYQKNEIEIVPKERKNELISFLKEGLEDICISRSAKRAFGWGIPVPEDKDQIIWVWFDALANYLTGIGFPQNLKNFKKWWPADLHLIGKGILRFHGIYWPAILLSANLPLFKKIFVHGYITVEGEKMSKSLKNVIDPFQVIEKYDSDSLRYFLLRESSPFKDLDFTWSKFEKRYRSDLVFGLGNLVSRILKLALKKKKFWKKGPILTEFKKEIEKGERNYHQKFFEFKFNECLFQIWSLISFADKYIDKTRPWEMIERKRGQKIISNLLFLLAKISFLLFPFLPKTSQKIKEFLGIRKETFQGLRLKKVEPLFLLKKSLPRN